MYTSVCGAVPVDGRLNVELGSFVYPSLMLEGSADSLGADLTSSAARRLHVANGSSSSCINIDDGACGGGEGIFSRRKR